jgi:hypothetical protein
MEERHVVHSSLEEAFDSFAAYVLQVVIQQAVDWLSGDTQLFDPTDDDTNAIGGLPTDPSGFPIDVVVNDSSE